MDFFFRSKFDLACLRKYFCACDWHWFAVRVLTSAEISFHLPLPYRRMACKNIRCSSIVHERLKRDFWGGIKTWRITDCDPFPLDRFPLVGFAVVGDRDDPSFRSAFLLVPLALESAFDEGTGDGARGRF